MATIIKAPVKNFTGLVAGVYFTDGVGKTSDPRALAYFRRQGYTIEGDKTPKPDFPEGEPTGKWTVDELKAYAAAKDLDLGEAKKKPEILAALAATPATSGDDSSGDAGNADD